MRVISDIDGVRNGTKRERLLVTQICVPSGDRARAQGLRLADSRLTGLRVVVSMTEILSAVMFSTYSSLPERSVSSAVRFAADGDRAAIDLSSGDVYDRHQVVELALT